MSNEGEHSVPAYDVILFDGPCNLCNRSVHWLISRDPKKQFRFAALDSEVGEQLLAEISKQIDLPDSIALITQAGEVSFRSNAVIGIARRLGFPWSMMMVGLIVPRFLRDGIYSLVARNRYRWFGKNDSCLVPSEDLKSRFLDL